MTEDPKMPSPRETAVQGEGNYEAAENYSKDVKGFVAERGNEIENLARAAEQSLEGEEGGELRAAEEEGKSHAKGVEKLS